MKWHGVKDLRHYVAGNYLSHDPIYTRANVDMSPGGPQDQKNVLLKKFHSNYKTFPIEIYIWKWRLQNCSHFSFLLKNSPIITIYCSGTRYVDKSKVLQCTCWWVVKKVVIKEYTSVVGLLHDYRVLFWQDRYLHNALWNNCVHFNTKYIHRYWIIALFHC